MNEYKKQFIKEYEILIILISNHTNEDIIKENLIMFFNRWNFIFRRCGYYNIDSSSVLYISSNIIKKLKTEII